VIVSPHAFTRVFAKLQQKAEAGMHRDSHQTSKTSSRTGDQLQQINLPARSLQLGTHRPFVFLRAPPAVCRRQPRTTRLPSSLNVSCAIHSNRELSIDCTWSSSCMASKQKTSEQCGKWMTPDVSYPVPFADLACSSIIS
jgi:hypothetical protein